MKDVIINCKDLTSLSIPDGVTSMKDIELKYASNLTSIALPESLTSIEPLSFIECSDLTSITVDDNNPVFSSKDGVLFNKDFTAVILYPKGKEGEYTIPDGVTSIADEAFRGCGITSVNMPDTLTSIGSKAFSYCWSLTSIHLSESVKNIGASAFEGSMLKKITADENNPYFSSIDGVLFNKDLTAIVVYPFGKRDDHSIPDSVKRIEAGAFEGCSMHTVTIPDGVTSIGERAFSKCSRLTSINIPDSVTSIGEFSFSYCESLTEITADENNPYFSSKDGVLFNKELTALLAYPGGKIGAYVIPDSVISIQDRAFAACPGLNSLTVPVGVISIGESAFEFCQNLEEVFYSGTKAQWDKIYVGEKNDALSNAEIHYSGSAE